MVNHLGDVLFIYMTNVIFSFHFRSVSFQSIDLFVLVIRPIIGLGKHDSQGEKCTFLVFITANGRECEVLVCLTGRKFKLIIQQQCLKQSLRVGQEKYRFILIDNIDWQPILIEIHFFAHWVNLRGFSVLIIELVEKIMT